MFLGKMENTVSSFKTEKVVYQKCISIIVIILFISVFSCSAWCAEPKLGPVNPAFTDFMQLPTMVQGTSNGFGLGLIPDPIPPGKHQLQFPIDGGNISDPKYDLRDPDLDGNLGDALVTPVRDQGSCGACWTFATYGSLESHLKKAFGLTETNNDYSEDNLKHLNGFDWGPCDGGNLSSMGTAYLSRYDGPISEADDPYDPSTTSDYCTDCTPVRYVDNIVQMPYRADVLDNTYIKQALLDYGALYVDMYYDDYYYNSTDHTYYLNVYTNSNHAVVIVGWDDAKVVTGGTGSPTPAGPGAFIVRNSYGSDWGDSGYFYVSYYDLTFAFGSLGYFDDKADSQLDFDKIYQYDPLGRTMTLGYGDKVDYGANVFTPDSDGQLIAVGLNAVADGMSYEIKIYDDFDGSSFSTLLASKTGSFQYRGYYTVKLDSSVSISAGDSFAVVIKFDATSSTDSTAEFPIPLEKPNSGYSSSASANAGESYTSGSGGSFTDVTTSYPNTNVCIKAFVSEAAVIAPEINLKQGAVNIADGGTYDYGSNHTVGFWSSATFTIENIGTADLTMTTPLSLGGTDPNSFYFVTQPSATVTAGASTTFQLQFRPTSSGPRSATISIANNDSDENPYILNLQGESTPIPAPEINLKQGATDIPDGGDYDFVGRGVNSAIDTVFTIQNTGTADLNLTDLPLVVSGADTDQFSIQAQPTSPIGPGNSVTFTVRFSPTSLGAKSATISILNSDADENPYNLTVTGTAQPGRATMISPEPYTPLAGAQATFTWNQSGADQYWLQVGTTLGGSDIYNQDQGASTQAVVSGLPYKGQTIFVRLWSKLDSVWKHNDYRYTAYDYSSEWAIITNPSLGYRLISRDVTFQWSHSDDATQYWLQVGTSLGGYDLYNQDQESTLTANVTNLPYNGETVYVRLWQKAFGEWFSDDYTYTACNFASAITNYGDCVFTETTANLSWYHVHGATQYYLYVGTTPGGKELYQGDQELNTSATISGLPQNGETVYVRLWSQVDGQWIYRDYIYTAVNKAAEISSPADGSVLGGVTETFQWNDASADQYWLLLGTSAGASDLFSSGALSNTTFSQTVDNLPFQGEMLYARLYSQIGGEWIYNDSICYAWDYSSTHTYMTSPSVASTFASREQTFEWTDSGAEQYWLQIGTALGGDDLYSADQGTTLTDTVYGLPHNGETVWARLWQKKYNVWTSRDYVYTAVNEAAAIYDPSDNAAFDSTVVAFHWNNVGAIQYWLFLGTSVGADDIYSGDQGVNTSATVSGLPNNGLKVYARLWSKVSGDWIYSDHVYNAVNQGAGIYQPNPGSTFASDTVQFCWNDAGADQYWLFVGSSQGGSDLYSGDQGTGFYRTVSGLPTNGQTVFAHIYSKINGQWIYNDHTYTADNGAASITSPTSDSPLGSTFMTFTWNDTGADQYWLSVGLTVGGSDIYSADQGRNLSATVFGLPHNGETVYVRLWSKMNGVWISRDHVYTATNDAAVISSPAPPTLWSERTVTFEWNDVGASQYWLYVGTTPGGSDLYSGDQGVNKSATVYGLPVNGETVYTRLWSKIDGDWIYSDAVYSDPPAAP